MRLLLAALILLAASMPSSAEAQVPVQVLHSGRDSVGQRLVFHYKEAIRASTTFSVALASELGFRVLIVTLDPNENERTRGLSTVYSIVWTWNNPENPFALYLTQMVGTCGADRLRHCAEDWLAQTNDQMERVAKILSAGQR